MATITTCDIIEGEQPAKPVQFTWDGDLYTIDLSEKGKEKATIAQLLAKATKLSSGRTKSTRTTSTGPSQNEVRTWALANGYAVKDRGRIAKDVVEAFLAAQGK